jgi:hypothetical protein
MFRSSSKRLPPDDVRRLASGLLSGLGAVHAQGFLHRDIKPSNIMVRRDGVPVLIDFGAARLAIGERSHTLTGVLTPQYAPIEQYALDGKQGPWSDIYSAAAVLHHAITGKPPPDAAARVGVDPYQPLADTEHDRYDRPFLAAVDRALSFAPAARPQSVEQWRTWFGSSLGNIQEAPTQRLASRAEEEGPRLGGVSRDPDEPRAAPPSRSSRAALWSVLVLVALAAVAVWRYHADIRAMLVGQPTVIAEKPTPSPPPSPPPSPVPAPQTRPSPTPQPPAPQPAAPAKPDVTPQQALIEQARRAAVEARRVFERADEASRAAKSMAGEARIVAARAARPDLENAERRTYDGATYIGQVVDGKRQGLGVAELADGERQAGDWEGDRLSGLGTVRFADDARYAGQWRDGLPTGLGARDKPNAERAEGNFVAGHLEGLGVRRTLGDPATAQTGEFHADLLEGPGVETVGDQRYEGGFRAGKRNGYGQVTASDGKVQSGRWADGKLVETTP